MVCTEEYHIRKKKGILIYLCLTPFLNNLPVSKVHPTSILGHPQKAEADGVAAIVWAVNIAISRAT